MADTYIRSLSEPITLVSSAIKQTHYPSLNGLRGISIIIVLMFHLHLSWNDSYFVFFNGPLGVNIFFVISGFLITTLCLKEKSLTGNLSLKNFYIRRVLRIFPVAYLYLLVLLLLNHYFHLEIASVQFLGAMFYVMDFSYFNSHNFSFMTGHYWSLSVEEQFYILFPFLLKVSTNFFFYAVIFTVVLLPFIYTFQEIYIPLNKGLLYFFTHLLIKFQSIAVGCLISILAFRKALDFKWLLSHKLLLNLIAIFFIFYLKYEPFYSIKTIFINLIISVLTGYIIISNIVPAKDFIYKVLNSRVLSFIGILSYSIYIWQEIFTLGDSRLPHFLISYPYKILFIAVVPCLSYFFYEKQFLKLKSKFNKLKTVKTDHLTEIIV